MFEPKRVIFEQDALKYKLGNELLDLFSKKDIDISYSKNGRITQVPGKTASEMYMGGKSTLVIGLRKTLDFESCKPSANFQLPLVSGCMGMCEYCYLNTQMGKKPYIKIYVNVEEILARAGEYIAKANPEITVFEGAATSDPIPVEPYSGALKATIQYFGKNENSLFRFVTKYTDVDSLLGIDHNKRTTIRFSINTDEIIKRFEHKTPTFSERIDAASKIAESGYKLGFIIAPVFLYDNWEQDYLFLIKTIYERFKHFEPMFEVISHRFTKRAKENILNVYPKSLLPMEEEIRKFKFGQFGYGKYVYRDEELGRMKDFFNFNIAKYFGEKSINYII